MTGRVTKKGARWYVVVDLGRTAEGKRKLRWFSGYATKREAAADRDRVLSQMRAGVYQEPSRLTVADYLDQWLRDYAQPQTAPTTYEGYESIVRLHLKPALGALLLGELRPLHIQSYYSDALKQGRADQGGALSPTTVLQHHRILHRALKQAVRWQLVPANVADAVTPPRKNTPAPTPLTKEQTAALLLAARHQPRLYLPIVLAAATGLRRGEVLALRWADLDAGGAVMVQRSLEVTQAGLSFKAPKTERSRRRVALPGFALRALAEHQEQQRQEAAAAGPDYVDQGLIIADALGGPVHPDRFSKQFLYFLRTRGLPVIRFHDLRHTHASQLLEANVHPKVVSERLGHSSIAITLNTYSHVLPSMGQAAADLIGAALDLAVLDAQEAAAERLVQGAGE